MTAIRQAPGGQVVETEKAGTILLVLRAPNGELSTRRCASQELTHLKQRSLALGLQVIAQQEIATRESRLAVSPSSFPTLLFSQQLLALLESGLTLTEALKTLLAKEPNPGTRRTLMQLDAALSQGLNFSSALAQHPRAFPELYVATIRAAEQTGDLAQALTRYIAYQQQFDDIRKKLVSAAIYPAMLLLVGGFVTLFLLGYVVPKFSMVYESAGRGLPWMSSWLLFFGQFVHRYSIPLAIGFLSVLLGGYVYLRSAAGRLAMHRVIAQLPWIAQQIQVFQLARFYRALSLLLTSGVALPQAMRMVSGLLTGLAGVHLQSALIAVESGHGLSQALAANQLSTPVTAKDYRRIALSHYWKHDSGDMIPDPDMEIGVYRDREMAEALTYQDMYQYNDVYSGPEGQADRRYYLHCNAFLEKWLEALAEQGHLLRK